MNKAPHYIAIEGPMRVGKTALAEALAQRLQARIARDAARASELDAYYKSRPCTEFRLQMRLLHERFQTLRAARIEHSHLPVISDFLFEKDKIYACLSLEDDELEVYDSYYGHFKAQLPTPDLVVYIQTTSEALRKRLAGSPAGPEANVSTAYLEGTVRAFEHFFSQYEAAPLKVVHAAELDVLSRPKDLEAVLEEVARTPGTQFHLPL